MSHNANPPTSRGGTLHVVATPIGNLEEMSPRAVRVLQEVTLIAAEDTRHTGKLLQHFAIATPMLSYHLFNEKAREERLLAALAGGDVALVTDAGTPAVADPGVALVRAAAAAGHPVVAVAGPSSLTAALSVSGLVEGPFIFLGFLPRKGEERAAALAPALASRLPLVIFESPQRIAATLADLAKAHGDRPASLSRELTKLHEETLRGTVAELAARTAIQEPRGEYVLVLGAAPTAAPDDPETLLRSLLAQGVRPRDAAKTAADLTGLPKSDLYARAIQIKDESKAGT